MNEDEILAAVQRPGWKVLSREKEVEDKSEPIIVAGRDTGNTRRLSAVPTGNTIWYIQGPNGEPGSVVVRENAPGTPFSGYAIVKPPDKAPPKADAASAVKTLPDPWGGQYEKDPVTGEWKVAVQGSQAQYQTDEAKLVEIRNKNADIDQNVAAGRGYLTTEQYQKLVNDQRTLGLDRDKFDEARRQFEQKNALDKKTEDRLLATSQAQIGLTRAQTAGTSVETAMNEERLRQLIATAPDEATAKKLSNELAELQMTEIRRKAGRPDIVDLGSGPTYGTMGPQGQIQENYRQGYVPKTQAEIAARTGQIQQLAAAKTAELQAKVEAKTITPEQGYAEFQTWHAANVAPHIDTLNAAREEAAIARGKDIAAQRTAAQTAATGMGTMVSNAANQQAQRTVGGGYIGAMGQLWNKMAGTDIDYVKAFERPDSNQVQQAQEAVSKTLNWIDPQAAAMNGNQSVQYQQMNPGDALNATNLYYGGKPVGPPAQPVPVPGATQQVAAQAQPTGDLFHATPIITNPQGGNEWSYQMQAANDALLQDQQAQVTGDLQELMAQEYNPEQYAPAAAIAPVRRRSLTALAPPTPAPPPIPFNQQALAAGLGAGGLGPENYYPPQYQYGGMYPTQNPW